MPIGLFAALLLLLASGTSCARRHVPDSLPRAAGPMRVQDTMRFVEGKPGAGSPADAGKLYVLHYTGWLWDGTKFDSSRDKGTPFSFEQGKRKVIPGFDAGFEGMRVGRTRRLFISYQLAYGKYGTAARRP